MAGPTPVSALIHAATMVTAGVYLIARTHVLFTLAPAAMTVTAVVGAATLLLAGFSGLTQWDIKRVLAYSTISQIGYMFLALGVGAWTAGIFHFMIHAFFKALLFLGAGSIIIVLDHEHNMFKMGGLRRQLPITFWTFLAGAGALSAVPLITSGFYSKDLIIWQSYASVRGSVWLWGAGVAGALLTSMYTFRLVFLTFFGPPHAQVDHRPGLRINLPLIVLAVLALTAGFINLPGSPDSLPPFTDFLRSALPPTSILPAKAGYEGSLAVLSGFVSLLGILIIYLFIRKWRRLTENLAESSAGSVLHRFWFSGWGFDWIYDRLLVHPYVRLARLGKDDVVDLFFDAMAWFGRLSYRGLSLTQTGHVRWYAAGMAAGAAVFIAMAVFL
jgi:NADH-quinone oxidoreductase subunit L